MRRLGPALLVAALTTACGSTVQMTSRTGYGDLTASSPGAAGSVLGPGQSSPDGSSPAGVPAGSGASGAPVAGGADVVPPGSDGASLGRLGPGVSAKTITIGLTVQQNSAAVSSIASTYNVQLADNAGAYAALVAWVNKHGGVGGRTLKPVWFSYDPTSGNGDQLGQAACSRFTEDSQVFAALDTFNGSSTFNQCMQQRGRLMLQYGLYFGTRASWQRYSNEVSAEGLPLDDAGRLLADHLSSTGFLSRTTKVGAIVRGSADLKAAYEQGFVPALARHGLKVEQAQVVRDAQDSSELAGYTTDISSAVLKFQSLGIDRVVFFDSGSYAALVFSQTADKQQYHPRYGFTSLNSVVALSGSGSAAPQDQMVGAQGISWETNADGLQTTRTTSATLCLSILRAAGITPSDAGTEASYLKTCQTFFLFRAAAEKAGPELTRDSFLAAVEGLGSSFVGTNTWGGATRFGPDDHSGASVFRPFAYDPGCSCFAVSGPARPVGAS